MRNESLIRDDVSRQASAPTALRLVAILGVAEWQVGSARSEELYQTPPGAQPDCQHEIDRQNGFLSCVRTLDGRH